MSSAEVIDALFERTIDIVQSLPKTGPIQTSYEEKLALYSLYKQATEGDVKGKRPGMLDMLGRAKWDAWAKRKGYGSQEAKQLYVESLLKTLRKFSDRPQAIALIEELESFSGDVAERVMSASLARAGSESSESSGSVPPRVPTHRGQMYSGSDGEEDERDIISQLPPRPTISSRPSSNRAGPSMHHSRRIGGGGEGVRTPMSVDEVSSMAVRGGGGPASRVLRESDSDDELPSRHSALPISQQFSRGTTSTRATVGQYGRGGPGSSSQQQDTRLYAPATTQRYPAPPRSESIVGGAFQTGGAGASLYSAIGPSRPTAASEQHYYHHHGAEAGTSRGYAASSIGGRSGGGGASVRGSRPEVEMALQSIQASLAAVHERLNQVESQSRTSSVGSILFGANNPLNMGYQALANAVHDIALLLGIGRDSRGVHVAPSSFQGHNRDGKRIEATKGKGRGDYKGPDRSAWSALFRLLITMIKLSIRLALDLTSVSVVFSLFVFIFKRVTGRGDPLFLFRLVQRYSNMIRARGKRLVEEPSLIKLG